MFHLCSHIDKKDVKPFFLIIFLKKEIFASFFTFIISYFTTHDYVYVILKLCECTHEDDALLIKKEKNYIWGAFKAFFFH